MDKKLKMNFKLFFEEVNNILDGCSINELKNIVKTMAANILPVNRDSFIEQISCYSRKETKLVQDVSDLLQKIEDLKSEIKDTADNAEDDYDYDYYDDEDCLGPFEDYVTELSGLFDETATAFDYGKDKLAREAYEKLFAILEIEDEYGRGVHADDLTGVELDETRARYICSVYLTEPPETRVEVLARTMDSMKHFGSGRPNLQEIIDIYDKQLPDFSSFIKKWIDFAASQSDDRFDSWLREGIKISEGAAGLEKLAKKQGIDRPRAYYDWVYALNTDGNYKDVVNAAAYSLNKLPKELPIRAAIADCLTSAADKLGDAKKVKEGRWLSFAAKPTLDKLITLAQQTKNDKSTAVMQNSIEIVKKCLCSDEKFYENKWENDYIDHQAYVTKTLLLHAHLLAQDFAGAFQLAKKDDPLGWSYNNCQPFFVACNFVIASGRSLSTAPERLKNFWSYAATGTLNHCYGSSADRVIDSLRALYEDILAKADPKIVDNYFSWCIKIAKERISQIVSNTHRGAYERAAILTSVCFELFKCRNETKKAVNFYNTIKQSFPRHNAFQRELKKIFKE